MEIDKETGEIVPSKNVSISSIVIDKLAFIDRTLSELSEYDSPVDRYKSAQYANHHAALLRDMCREAEVGKEMMQAAIERYCSTRLARGLALLDMTKNKGAATTPLQSVRALTYDELGIVYRDAFQDQLVARMHREETEELDDFKAKHLEQQSLSWAALFRYAENFLKKKAVRQKLEDIGELEAKVAEGIFDVIVIDPPWPINKIEREVAPNQVLLDYPTMSLEEIGKLEIPYARDCHVWLWTTHKFLPFAFDLLKQWGLKYVCTFVWHKSGGFQPFELPQYNCEFALYARRGTPLFMDLTDFKVCFTAPRGEHSEKPESFYQMIRQTTLGRRLDMFNRRQIEGFETWGNQAS